jgi:hypothetical protein
LAASLGLGQSEASLVNLIAKRQEQRANEAESFLDSLAAKYGGGGGGGGGSAKKRGSKKK